MIIIQLNSEQLSDLVQSSVRMALKETKTQSLMTSQNAIPQRLMNIKEAAKFLNVAIQTLYTKVSKNEIPHMKRGKRLYFDGQELMQYLREGKKKTVSEIEAEAEAFLMSQKG